MIFYNKTDSHIQIKGYKSSVDNILIPILIIFFSIPFFSEQLKTSIFVNVHEAKFSYQKLKLVKQSYSVGIIIHVLHQATRINILFGGNESK